MDNRIDFLAIGDITTDAFIRLSNAHVTDCVDHRQKELCVSFGDKIPFDFVEVVRGVGNSPNGAVSAARLGLSSALLAHVGSDQNGKECIEEMKKNGVITDFIQTHEGKETNYHYVLWYAQERTILVKHHEYPYGLPKNMPEPKWMYLSSMGENSVPFHTEIAEYLSAHPNVKLAFQPGTFQIALGVEKLKNIYEHAEVFFCNVEEAQRILKADHRDVKKLMADLKALGPNIVIVTDGIDGAYAFDGSEAWFVPVYPQEPYERTGAGDAFASTVTSMLALGKPLSEAILLAPINSMSVVLQIGAQKGLLTQEKLLEYLENAPAEYTVKKI